MSRRNSLLAFDTYPESASIEKYPVVLTRAELEAILKRGKLLCLHDWVHRKDRDVGGLRIIVSDTEIRDSNIPSGRYCTKCGKVEWCAAKDDSFVWTQTDFTPKR